MNQKNHYLEQKIKKLIGLMKAKKCNYLTDDNHEKKKQKTQKSVQ